MLHGFFSLDSEPPDRAGLAHPLICDGTYLWSERILSHKFVPCQRQEKNKCDFVK